MPEAKEQRLELGHGLELGCSFPELAGSVRVRLSFRDHRIFERTLTREGTREGFEFSTRVARGEGKVELDPFAGELSWGLRLELRDPIVTGPEDDEWESVLNRDGVLRFCPALGEVGGSAEVVEPVVDDPRYGRSQLCTPAVLRIFVDEQEREIAEVGKLVKRQMFGEHPPFVFNTVACVGAVPDGTPGLYPDPSSDWFNVFFGYYQLDCAKSEWSRPFGYRSADGPASELEPDDILRLGKSDWNWFSNWMYGVPAQHVEPYSEPRCARVEARPPRRIGESLWHGLLMRGIEVASCYESGADGAARLVTNTIVDDVWRHAFGLPSPRPDQPVSFVPTLIDAQVEMAYWEDAEAFHTLIFGGTRPADGDPAFLEAQMEAVRAVIESSYPRLGFAAS
jgi:hypothetical protein